MTESIRKMTDPGVTVQNNDACEVLRLGKLYLSTVLEEVGYHDEYCNHVRRSIRRQLVNQICYIS